MAYALFHCSVCGEHRRDPSEVIVVSYGTGSTKPSAGWWCACGQNWVELDDFKEVNRLIGAGAKLVQPPAEAREPHRGPALTLDDLIDFHRLLGRYGCLVALAELATVRKAVA